MTTSILKISRETNNHFRFTLSIITPAKIAKTNPGAVADAIIFPKRYSEPLSSNTLDMLHLLKNKTFLLFFIGNITSLIGFGFNLIAISWMVLEKSGS